jgi:hypothetical protein
LEKLEKTSAKTMNFKIIRKSFILEPREERIKEFSDRKRLLRKEFCKAK